MNNKICDRVIHVQATRVPNLLSVDQNCFFPMQTLPCRLEQKKACCLEMQTTLLCRRQDPHRDRHPNHPSMMKCALPWSVSSLRAKQFHPCKLHLTATSFQRNHYQAAKHEHVAARSDSQEPLMAFDHRSPISFSCCSVHCRKWQQQTTVSQILRLSLDEVGVHHNFYHWERQTVDVRVPPCAQDDAAGHLSSCPTMRRSLDVPFLPSCCPQKFFGHLGRCSSIR